MILYACCYTHAQELVVKSFEHKALDLTARSNVRYDANGIPCALLIVQSTVKDLQFRGAIIGEIKHDLNEYYIYLPEGAKHIKILSQDYMPLEKGKLGRFSYPSIPNESEFDRIFCELYPLTRLWTGSGQAHERLDGIVESCYPGAPFASDEARLECLFKLYEKMTNKK